MKNTILILLLALLTAGAARAGTAELQVIHNAADPGAAVVDVYVNGDLLLDDFAFRTATPFVPVPAGVTLGIGVAPGDSDGPEDILATFDVVLENRNRYVVMANGVLDPGAFAANPDGLPVAFSLYPQGDVPRRTWFGTRILPFHGATDAPAVDIYRRNAHGARRLVADLSYGEFGRMKTLWSRETVLDVTPAGAPETVVASFTADLSGLRGEVVTVFASGFLDPAANGDGAAFGLFAALDDGAVVALPAVGRTAELQVVHNAADPAAAEVDIYLNGDLLLDDFAFRTATPFVEVPAGVDLVVGVAPGDSEGAEDVLADFTVNLQAANRYVVMANGVLDPGAFAANPDGASTGFSLFPLGGVKEGPSYNLTRLYAFHGATDAPAVDISTRTWFGRYTLFRDLGYGEFGGDRLALPGRFVLNVSPAGDPHTVVASFVADLRGLGRSTAVVFASGFLDPAANGGGAGFGLFAVLADGTVAALPAATKADLQDDGADKAAVPLAFGLESNYPNPFNPTTTVAFNLPRESRVRLEVLDVRGRVVDRLLDGVRAEGRHTVTFSGEGLASGTYFARIVTDSGVDTRKMTLVK